MKIPKEVLESDEFKMGVDYCRKHEVEPFVEAVRKLRKPGMWQGLAEALPSLLRELKKYDK